MLRESFHKDIITVPLKSSTKMYKKKKNVSLTSPQSKLDHSNYEIWGKEQGFFQYCDKKQNLHVHLKQREFHHQEVKTVMIRFPHGSKYIHR